MVGRKVKGIGVVCAALVAVGVITLHPRGGSAGAQDLAPAAITSGVLQFDTGGADRIFDTRSGLGRSASAGPFVPGPAGRLVFTPGVPQGASAALVNITVVADQPGSYGYAAAQGTAPKLTSNVNWTGPGVYANFAMVPISYIPDPFFVLHVEGNNPVNVVVDLQGWVVPAT
jgi:hypothetical protein